MCAARSHSPSRTPSGIRRGFPDARQLIHVSCVQAGGRGAVHPNRSSVNGAQIFVTFDPTTDGPVGDSVIRVCRQDSTIEVASGSRGARPAEECETIWPGEAAEALRWSADDWSRRTRPVSVDFDSPVCLLPLWCLSGGNVLVLNLALRHAPSLIILVGDHAPLGLARQTLLLSLARLSATSILHLTPTAPPCLAARQPNNSVFIETGHPISMDVLGWIARGSSRHPNVSRAVWEAGATTPVPAAKEATPVHTLHLVDAGDSEDDVPSLSLSYSLLAGCLFTIFALLQLNDPDATAWVAGYLAAGPAPLLLPDRFVGALAPVALSSLVLVTLEHASAATTHAAETDTSFMETESGREAGGLALLTAHWLVLSLGRSRYGRLRRLFLRPLSLLLSLLFAAALGTLVFGQSSLTDRLPVEHCRSIVGL